MCILLLWRVLGLQISWQKALLGREVQWIGALLQVEYQQGLAAFVVVTLTPEKIQKLDETISELMDKRTVQGCSTFICRIDGVDRHHHPHVETVFCHALGGTRF